MIEEEKRIVKHEKLKGVGDVRQINKENMRRDNKHYRPSEKVIRKKLPLIKLPKI